MNDSVHVTCHLIVGAKVAPKYHGSNELTVRGKPSVRVSIGKPSTKPDEIAIALKLKLPSALFSRPQLTAEITIPEEKSPFIISPEVKENIAEQIRRQTGFSVEITAAAPAPDAE